MHDCDVLIIGAGHNALVCAAYLAQAGERVLVLERRHKVGGAVVTEEIVPGFQFDLGGSAHILINHTPIVRDLRLHEYGLDYLDLDPILYHPFPDDTAITMYRSVEATCESIAAVSPEDAEHYRQFVREWMPMAEGMVEAFNHAPSPLNLARYLVLSQGIGRETLERVTHILRPYGQTVRERFTSPKVQALVGWMAAQSGPPPSEPFSAPFALWHPMYHVSGMKRPRGGSGMLTQALARMIEAHGGRICTDQPVSRIVVEGGRAVGAQTANGATYTAKKAVVSGAHIHTTFAMLGDAAPLEIQKRVRNARVGNGFGLMVRMAVRELPQYTAAKNTGQLTQAHTAMQFICPDLSYLERAYGDYAAGRPSECPGLISMTWSAVDPSLAPPGQHVLFLWGQYFPYQRADGRAWDEPGVAEHEADKMLAILRQYAPNMTDDVVIGRLIQTPLWLERELGLLRGNVMHLEMSTDQMFSLRPALGLGMYRTPIRDLYLTGASTHPGGGIMGASGRNAAAAVLKGISSSSSC